MATEATLKIVGDWKIIGTAPLKDALAVSVAMFGRTTPEACKHAVTLMAQSAAAMTPKGKARRPVLRDVMGPYVETWKQGDTSPKRLYKFKFMPGNMAKRQELTGDWEAAKRIANTGVGKRSWMWQLGGGAAIPGASYVSAFKAGDKAVGYVKRNKMSYILKILPGGWQEVCAQKATNKILAQAAKKIGAAFHRAITRAA
jgi:hypothetical protein